MFTKSALIALAAVLFLAHPVIGQEQSKRFRVTYLSGHTDWKQKFDGGIIVTSEAVRIVFRNTSWPNRHEDKTVLEIPAAQIVNAVVTPQDDDKIIVTWESETAAEALYFDVKDHEAPAVVAKINFARKHQPQP